MSKYRIQYTQGDEVKYISHLDFLRTINRVFARADLPIKFSNGFNPHPVMTIGLPLSVGTTSECDVLDVELTCDMDTAELIERMNKNCPPGIKVTAAKRAENLKPLFNIDSAVYTARFDADCDPKIDLFAAADKVMIEKKSKRGMKEVNIKDFIRSLGKTDGGDREYGLIMHINAGNFSNLKPELVLSALGGFSGVKLKNIAINRKKIFFDDGKPVFEYMTEAKHE